MPALTATLTLSDGTPIPQVGFGTWQVPDGAPVYSAVRTALDVGYRHIDTALAYGNEKSVGRAVRDSGVDRAEIFLTTKLPAELKSADAARSAFEKSLSELDLGWIDLYLIHAPWPWSEMGADYRRENIAVWGALEDLVGSGRSRSIGVSNFQIADLESLTDATDVLPAANQIRWYAGNTQPEVTRWCQEREILVEGYSPLATGDLLTSPALVSIADRAGRTPAQVALRYLLHKDVLPLPKSTTPTRIRENADLDFTLTQQDLTELDKLSAATA